MEKSLKKLGHDLIYLEWEKLKTFTANKLKEKNSVNIEKLKNSILEKGFFAPIFIWESYIIDGSSRFEALQLLEVQGYKIDKIPAIKIFAGDINEAKEFVLLVSSNYGKITCSSLEDFIDFELDRESFISIASIDELDISLLQDDFFAQDEEIITKEDLFGSQEVRDEKKVKKLVLNFDEEKYFAVKEKLKSVKVVHELKNLEEAFLHCIQL